MSKRVHLKRVHYIAPMYLSPVETLEWSLKQAVLRDVESLIRIHYNPKNQTAEATLYIADVDEEEAKTLNVTQYNKDEENV